MDWVVPEVGKPTPSLGTPLWSMQAMPSIRRPSQQHQPEERKILDSLGQCLYWFQPALTIFKRSLASRDRQLWVKHRPMSRQVGKISAPKPKQLTAGPTPWQVGGPLLDTPIMAQDGCSGASFFSGVRAGDRVGEGKFARGNITPTLHKLPSANYANREQRTLVQGESEKTLKRRQLRKAR